MTHVNQIMKSAALAVAIALALPASVYACDDHGKDASHSNEKSAQMYDVGNDGALGVWSSQHDPYAWNEGMESGDLAAASDALASHLTDDEHVIEVQNDAGDNRWAVVLGGFCETESNCIQYTRLLALSEHNLGADITNSLSLQSKGEAAGRHDFNLGAVPKALPSLHMANVVIQAQVEPFRGSQPNLAGNADVIRVQQGLIAKGISTTADGWYGNGTTAAYATWQRRLGYTGLDATGIPGPSSLASLGQNRFVLTNKITVGSRTTFSGKTVNQRTYSMLRAAERLTGRSIRVTQGSYNPGGVGASGGTHDGGGAVDISVSSLSETQRWQLVKALRRVGFAAWYRTPSQGPWSAHIHAIAIGDTDVSLSARNQVADYYVGKNGLASHAADNTPSAYRVPFTWWEKY